MLYRLIRIHYYYTFLLIITSIRRVLLLLTVLQYTDTHSGETVCVHPSIQFAVHVHEVLYS